MTRTAAVLLILGCLLLVAGIGLAIDVPAALMSAGALIGVAGVMNLERRP
jgi:hypothetical protein